MMDNEKKLVTVIIPCYNIEDYVKKCIDSILFQSYKNLEIIIVDDGSTDNTSKIIDSYDDKRIRIIHQENAGLSGARNTGIENAKGEYICFIDGDDFIHENYVKKMMNIAEAENADVVACGFFGVDKNGNVKKNNIVNSQMVMSGLEAMVDYLNTRNIGYSMAWNKLYKTSLFKENKITYPYGRLHEDEHVIYKLYYFSQKIVVIPDHLYFYIKRDDSIMGKKYSAKRLEDALSHIEEVKEFMKMHSLPGYIMEHLIAYEINMKKYLLKLIVNNKIKTARKREIIDFLKTHKKDIYNNRYVSKTTKLVYPFLGIIRSIG